MKIALILLLLTTFANSGAGGSSAWCINAADAPGGTGGSGFALITENCTS